MDNVWTALGVFLVLFGILVYLRWIHPWINPETDLFGNFSRRVQKWMFRVGIFVALILALGIVFWWK